MLPAESPNGASPSTAPLPAPRRRKKQAAPPIPVTVITPASTEIHPNAAATTPAPPTLPTLVESVASPASTASPTIQPSTVPVQSTPSPSPVPHHSLHKPIAGMQRTYPREYERLLAALKPDWPLVAERMQFTADNIINLIPMTAIRFDIGEPEVLLALWGDQLNHTLTELFVVLGRQPAQRDAMLAFRHLVPVAYHVLLPPQDDAAADAAAAAPILEARAANHGNRLGRELAKKLNVTLSDEENATDPQNPNAVFGSNSNTTTGAALLAQLAGNIPRIPYAELTAATRNWSAENVLGAGGFGTVFHGRWKQTMVAIKRVKATAAANAQSARLEHQQGLNELRHLNSCRHDNILPLYGFSLEPNGDPCLVYKLMTGGSLESRLSEQRVAPALRWPDRMRIAIGTARGLQYLHTLHKVPIIHGDIKPANILLDDCCEPKIGDFGLTRVGAADDANVAVSRVFGTRPYLPVDFLADKALSTKVDTFSFGVVLLELATSLRAHHKRYGFLHRYTRQLDRDGRMRLIPPQAGDIASDCSVDTFKALMRLGRQCTEAEAMQRPEMVDVLANLQLCEAEW